MNELTPGTVVQAIVAAVLFVGMLLLYLLRFARSGRWVAVTLLVCLLDQGVKAIVSPALIPKRLSLLGGWLRITYAENYEQGFGGNFSSLLLMTLICVAALYVLYERLLKARYRMSPLAELAVALMIGGYLGILFDRVRLGFVIDFLEFGPASAFVYNIADLAVFVALALFLVRGIHYLQEVWRRHSAVRERVIEWPKTH